MVCAGVVAPASFARESAICPKTSFSCCAIPFVVSTRFGMRSLRRCSWFSTCAHCAFMLSSLLTNELYEQPEDTLAASSSITSIVDRICRVIIPSASIPHSAFTSGNFPARSATAASAAASAKPSEAAAKPTPPASEAATSTAERADAAVPSAPAASAPARTEPAAPPRPPDGVEEDKDDEKHPDEVSTGADVGSATTRLGRDCPKPDLASLRNAGNDTGQACKQTWSVRAAAEFGRHVLPADFTGKNVGDELLEVVADFDPHLPVVHGQKHEGTVVLGALSDPASVVFEHLDGILADVRVRLESRDGRHDDDVAAGLLQRSYEGLHCVLALVVYHVGEVVD